MTITHVKAKKNIALKIGMSALFAVVLISDSALSFAQYVPPAFEVIIIVNNNGTEAISYGSIQGEGDQKMLSPGQDSLNKYLYIFPGNYDFVKVNNLDFVDFHSHGFATMKNIEIKKSLDKDGIDIFNFRKDQPNPGGHHGYCMLGDGASFKQFAFVFVCPSQYRIIDYKASCSGRWTEKDAVLSFFATGVNDIDIAVNFQKRPEIIKHDTIIAHCEELERLYENLAELHKKDSLAREELINKIGLSSDKGNLEIVNTTSGINITLSEKLLFTSGNATVGSEGMNILNSVAEKLKAFGHYRIIISGHTDNVQIAKHNIYTNNWELSSARALNVAQALIADGTPENSIEIRALGQTQPRASNDTSEGRALNRRIEIEVVKIQ